MDSFKPFSLEGGSVLCGSKAYSIANLPMGANVSWSLISGNTSCVSLQSDSPSANQCTLTLNNASGFNTVTLQADVIMNGVTVKSLQKVISKPWTLEVTNALTGRKTFSKEVAEPSFLLHTDGWEAGVYVVRALVGDASLAGKITVK